MLRNNPGNARACPAGLQAPMHYVSVTSTPPSSGIVSQARLAEVGLACETTSGTVHRCLVFEQEVLVQDMHYSNAAKPLGCSSKPYKVLLVPEA